MPSALEKWGPQDALVSAMPWERVSWILMTNSQIRQCVHFFTVSLVYAGLDL